MPELTNERGPSEDMIFRFRAKMDDHAYQVVEESGGNTLVFRVPGDNIDLLNSLEYLAEYLNPESLEGVAHLMIISDKDYHVTEATMLAPKLEVKKEDDEKLYGELKGSLKKNLDPLVFTMENDINELYRTAIKVEGSHNRSDSSVGLDLLKVELPKEGDVVYLIFEDGYRKMSRRSFERLVDEALSSLRQGPSLARDPPSGSLSKKGPVFGSRSESPKSLNSKNDMKLDLAAKTQANEREDISMEPKVIAREFSKEMSSMGYRKDTMFSRHDVNQFFFIGLKGPAVFFKVMDDPEELDSFLRVLSHRRDALGVLITDKWDPRIEAISRINGFIYMEKERSSRAPDVIRAVLREGGNS
jgi:hypothetical protein